MSAPERIEPEQIKREYTREQEAILLDRALELAAKACRHFTAGMPEVADVLDRHRAEAYKERAFLEAAMVMIVAGIKADLYLDAHDRMWDAQAIADNADVARAYKAAETAYRALTGVGTAPPQDAQGIPVAGEVTSLQKATDQISEGICISGLTPQDALAAIVAEMRQSQVELNRKWGNDGQAQAGEYRLRTVLWAKAIEAAAKEKDAEIARLRARLGE